MYKYTKFDPIHNGDYSPFDEDKGEDVDWVVMIDIRVQLIAICECMMTVMFLLPPYRRYSKDQSSHSLF